MSRLDRAGSAVAVALSLRLLPAAGEPGHMSPGELAAGLATIFRARLDPCERLALAGAAMMSLDRGAAEELVAATLHDLRATHPMRRART